ncbi:conserved oligomeric Golgi complex subunit 2-like isoform X2 [Mustela putorius furo]|uniref:Conserved oligomeric Golgi complex subunit 2 n=1 Tax=Mustela putorius furo TaxID=9669 RepID=A0A8U0V292_MUSPF|nr:conserved oligomeric Golgi complex subunit 2-like isoform X2 [Mustela putorius furo]
MERSKMNLPKGADTLCFDKDEFMKEDFDVDHFVSDCRKCVQLEELRGDLELYYKLLKIAMVQLINKDYADFFNLSTNLVGMDKALNELSVPLGQLQEVLSLRSSVSEGIRAVDEQMCKQEDIRKKKVIVEQIVESHPDGLKIMYANKLLEFVPHHCRLLREVTGGAISRKKRLGHRQYRLKDNRLKTEWRTQLSASQGETFEESNPTATLILDF